ncbi:MAG TPA: hemagglutinin repeat-containing protein [Pseudoxanthomonas sp.]|nr:hemagglutinin repeat-containing protein [Pseudoxanthomonas sp.]
MRVAGVLDNDGGSIRAGGAIGLDVDDGLDNSGGRLAAERLALSRGTLANAGGELHVAGNLDLTLERVTNAGGHLEAEGVLGIRTQSLDNRGGALVQRGTGASALEVAGDFDNSDGIVSTRASAFAIASGQLRNERGRIEHAGDAGMNLRADGFAGRDGIVVTGGDLAFRAGQADHRGATLSAAGIALEADGFDNRGGAVLAGGHGVLRVRQVLDNAQGMLASRAELEITAATFANAAGTVQAGGDLNVQAARVDGAGGTLASQDALALAAGSVDLRGGTTQADSIALDADVLVTAAGKVAATGDRALSITARERMDNAGGHLVGNGTLALEAGTLVNRDGVIATAGEGGSSLRVAGRLDNARGTLATGGDATLAAGELDNRDGAVKAAGVLRIEAAGRLDNASGLLAAEGGLDISAATMDATGGRIANAGSGALDIRTQRLDAAGATFASAGALSLAAGEMGLRGASLGAERIAIDAGRLDTARGRLVASGTQALQVAVREGWDNTGGRVAGNGVLDVSAQWLENRHGMLSAAGTGSSRIVVAGMLDNAGGTVAVGGDLEAGSAGLDNRDGTLQAQGSLRVDASGYLDNSDGGLLASGAGMALSTGVLDNTGGTIRHAGDGLLWLSVGVLEAAGGTILSNGALELGGWTVDLRDATTQARSIAIRAGELLTAHGTLTATGRGPLVLTASQRIDNTEGRIASNGALRLDTTALANAGGVITAAGTDESSVTVADTLDNRGGVLETGGDTHVQAGQLDNRGGTLRASGTGALQLEVDGLLDNTGGRIGSGGDMRLSARELVNAGGSLRHAGEGVLAIATGTLAGEGGTIASNGALEVAARQVDLRDGDTTAGRITIEADTITTAGGVLAASGPEALAIVARERLDNAGGRIATNGAFQLQAPVLDNRAGMIVAAGAQAGWLTAATLLDNRTGAILSAGDTVVRAGEVANAGGRVLAAGQARLEVTADGRIDNGGGSISAGGDLGLAAQHLDNTAGTIEHAGDGTLEIAAGTVDGKDGALASNGTLVLATGRADLEGGDTIARRIAIDAGELTTAGGTLLATGGEALSLQVRGLLDNARGTIAGNGTLELVAGALDNTGGALEAAGSGNSRVAVAGTWANTGGSVALGGDAELRAHELDNRNGALGAAGALQVATGGRLDNDGGTIEAGAGLALDTAHLRNAGGAIRNGDGALDIDAAVLDGAGGFIASAGTLVLEGERTDLSGGSVVAERITVDTGTLVTAGGSLAASGAGMALAARDRLDNSDGRIASSGGLDVSAGALDNAGGILAATGGGSVDVAGTLDNARGTVTLGGGTRIEAGEVRNARGVIQGGYGESLAIRVRGQLVNDGGTIHNDGQLRLDAGTLSNAGGAVRSRQDVVVEVRGTFDNHGGLVVAEGDLDASAGHLVNRGTLGEAQGLFGAQVRLAAGDLDNAGGRIGADGSLALAGGTLGNVDGLIEAGGGIAVTAQAFDNRGGTLLQHGDPAQAGDEDGSLSLVLDGALDNRGGLVGAAGNATVHAGSVDNGAGVLAAHGSLALASAGVFGNRDGGLLRGTTGLTLHAGGLFDNTGGVFDTPGAATLQAGAIANAGGQIMAGAEDAEAGPDATPALTVATTGTLDNRGGLLGSRSGDLSVAAGRIDNGADGLLVAPRDLTVDAAALDNAGTVYAGRDLRYQTATGVLDNRGRLGAGENAWIGVASLRNGGAGHVQAATLELSAGAMELAGGQIAADVLRAELGTLTGAGLLYGGRWLDLDIAGDFTYAGGQRLETDGVLDLAVGGTLTNLGTIQAADALALSAGGLVNQGMLNAGNGEGTGVLSVHAGSVDNHGSMEGDLVEVQAGSLANTGDIVGDVVAIRSGTVTNGRDLGREDATRAYGEGFIGAADYLELAVGRLSNLDAELFSAGDLAIIGRHGGSASRVDNVSGRIQAEGGLYVAASTLDNRRRVMEYVNRDLTPAEQEAARRAIPAEEWTSYHAAYESEHAGRCSGATYDCQLVLSSYRETATPLNEVAITRSSAAAQLLSGGGMVLEAATLYNRASAIAAGGSLLINGSAAGEGAPGVFNESFAGMQTWEVTAHYGVQYRYCAGDLHSCAAGNGYAVTGYAGSYGPVRVRHPYAPEEGRATITAGGSLAIASGGDVTNTAVVTSGGPAPLSPVQAGPGSGEVAFGGAGHAPDAGSGVPVSVDVGAGDPGPVGPGPRPVDSREVVLSAGPGGAQRVRLRRETLVALQGERVAVDAGPGMARAPDLSPVGGPPPALAQSLGTPEQPLPGLQLPETGMYRTEPGPGAAFLVSTAPRFARGEQGGSEYLLDRLDASIDTHKRLGDGHYERRLVLEQIMQLTGRRNLAGAADDGDGLAQYRALMDGAAAAAAQLGLSLGAPLTSTQVAALEQDIVWLVEQEVAGERVLVPVVYLSQATASQLASRGALMSGGQALEVQAAGTVRNDGTLQGGHGAWLSADALINTGVVGGGSVQVATSGDVRNRGRLSGSTVVVDAGGDFMQDARGRVESSGAATVRAGRNLDLTRTTVAGAGPVTLAAGQDLRVTATQVLSGSSLALSAGQDLVLTNRSTTAAGGSMALQAGRDLAVREATVTAGEDLVARAGRDLDVESVSQEATLRTTAARHGKSRVATTTSTQGLDVQALVAGGDLVLEAGHDVNLAAARLEAGRNLAVTAGNDLNATTLTTTDTSSTLETRRRFRRATTTVDETVHGTTFNAGGDVALQAGRDVNLAAATVASDTGAVAVAGGRDVNLLAARETHAFAQETVKKKKGTFSSTTTTTRDQVTDTLVVGTTLSGETVQVAAGRDLTTQAAQIAGTDGVALAAGGDVVIGTGRNTRSESYASTRKKSGMFSSGGLGVTIGSQRIGRTAEVETASHAGSLIGSTDGRVDIVAGNDVTITGSDVLSKTGVGISGRNVAIEHAEDTRQVREGQTFKQGGLNVSLKGGAVDVAMNVYGAARRSSEVEDDRLKALYAAQAGQTLFSGGQAGIDQLGSVGQQFGELANTARTGETRGGNGINLRIGIGASRSSSRMEHTETTARGSRVASEGDVAIAAHAGDLGITGSVVEGDDVALAAAQDLVLRSARESHATAARDKASSGEIGITIGTEAGIGVYVSATAARGKGDGSGTTHAEARVTAANTLALSSGRDTTLEGAQAAGESVAATVGRDLTLASQQDSNDYRRKDQSAGLDVAVGAGGGSASGYYDRSRIDSRYASVNEQTGIQAGSGGFDIVVGGHTGLTGAAIASTADASRNRLSTGTLSAGDLRNETEYEASSVGFRASGGNGGGSFTPGIAPTQSDAERSVTRSGISEGTLETRDGGEGAPASVARNVNGLQQSGLEDIFDEREVSEGQAFAAGLSDLAVKLVDDIYSAKLATRQEEIDAVLATAKRESVEGNADLASQLYEQAAYMRDRRDDGHALAIAKSIAALGVSALAGNVSLESGLVYSAVGSGIGFWDEAADKAMRGHEETIAIKITCTRAAQECADIRLPDNLSTEQRVQFLREHGVAVEFTDEIPEGAESIAVNGILNDQARAGHVQVGHVERKEGDTTGVTFYVQYNASKGALSDLMQAGYDKFVSPLNNDYSATTLALVNAVYRQGDAAVDLFAHSWGSIVTRNALDLLADSGYQNKLLTVAVFGPAVRPGALVAHMERIVGNDRVFLNAEQHYAGMKPALSYFSNPSDFVATFVGGTLFPSRHLNNDSGEHLPGAAQGQMWDALRGLPAILKGPINPHSCYGLNCAGTPYNWTEERARTWRRKPAPPKPPSNPGNSSLQGGGQ